MKAKSGSARADVAATPGRVLTDKEKLDWLRLIRTPYVGSVTFWDLLDCFGTASAALDALPGFAKHGSRISPRSIPARAAAEAELDRAQEAGMRLVATLDAGYPPLLSKVEAPPPLLYVKGCDEFWDNPPIAIVGSRRATAAGLKFAAQIAAALSENGLRVVSGLARGIDAAAHRASLFWGTAAVLPGGLDLIYPEMHAQLAEEITQNGVILSECPPGFVARAQDFPRRNRIISGSSLGVIVVEAAERSGSLITARIAGEQNREVFAVPGHPLDPSAAGTNGLIRQGAILTTSARDVEEALATLLNSWNGEAMDRRPVGHGGADRAPATKPAAPLPFDALDETTREVLRVLSVAPVEVDDLVRVTGIEARHVSAALIALELSGCLDRRPNGRVALKPGG